MVISPSTRFATFSRAKALFVIILMIGVVDGCLVQGHHLPLMELDKLWFSEDATLYREISARVSIGEAYYDAASSELEARGYRRESLFFWRLPVYAWMFGRLPSPSWAVSLLVAGIGLGVILAAWVVSRESGRGLGLGVAISLAVTCGGWMRHPDSAYFMELWAGVALLITAILLAANRWVGAVIAGGFALGLRELSLPICSLWWVSAPWRGGRREFQAWSALIAVFVLVLYFHYRAVSHHVDIGSNVGGLEWVNFGGIPFLLSCCRMTYPLMMLPEWCVAIYAPLALLGLFGWSSRSAWPFQGTVAAYLLIFAIVGKPANFYWGWMFTPCLAMGVPWAPLAIRDLIVALTR